MVPTQKYTIATTDYISWGKDGFDAITKGTYLIDPENGPNLLDILREFFNIPSDAANRKEFMSLKSKNKF
jgi:hypothetical protein